MDHIQLEEQLRARIKKRRGAILLCSALCLGIAILFAILYAQSRTVTVIGEGRFQYQSVTYNYGLAFGIGFGLLGLVPCASFLLVDHLCSTVVTFEVSGDHVTLYRGFIHNNLYVNGECKDSVCNGYHLEAPLSDGTKVNAALGKWSAHLTFSNGHPPIDV